MFRYLPAEKLLFGTITRSPLEMLKKAVKKNIFQKVFEPSQLSNIVSSEASSKLPRTPIPSDPTQFTNSSVNSSLARNTTRK